MDRQRGRQTGREGRKGRKEGRVEKAKDEDQRWVGVRVDYMGAGTQGGCWARDGTGEKRKNKREETNGESVQ